MNTIYSIQKAIITERHIAPSLQETIEVLFCVLSSDEKEWFINKVIGLADEGDEAAIRWLHDYGYIAGR
jgi:hypothetical protein